MLTFTVDAVRWDNANKCYTGEWLTLEAKKTDAPRFWSASGYGAKIPTCTMVRYNGKWRRVYVACFSNAGTAYIGKPGAWELIVS
jgi:hypothetical protein